MMAFTPQIRRVPLGLFKGLEEGCADTDIGDRFLLLKEGKDNQQTLSESWMNFPHLS